MANNTKLSSLNTNGLGIEEKRIAVFEKLKILNNITLLQETHCTTVNEKKWKNEYNNANILFSNGTSSQNGVATIIPNHLNYSLLDTKKDTEGRLLIVKMKLHNCEYVLVNAYAPTKDHKKEQLNFANTLKSKLAEFENDSIIIGGDLNIYLDPKLDKHDSISNKNDHPQYRKEILAIMETFQLVDCWRILNPTKRRFTWHARGKASRLDYWLISEHLMNDLNNCDILPGLHSDHSIIQAQFGNNELKRGKGIWKFNTSLLYDSNYVSKVKNIISECKSEYSDLEDKGLAWEMCKLKIRSFSVPYCIKKSKDKKKFKLDLENQLKQLQSEIDQNTTPENLEAFNSTKKELETIERHTANGHIFRSKCKWYEEGEKNTKYFTSLEKRNYDNKVISQLQIDNKIIESPKEILDEEKKFYSNLYTESLSIHDDTYKKSSDYFFDEKDTFPNLDSVQKDMCDKEITEREITESIKELKNGRTPGSDGLPSEFYKFFWVDVKSFVFDSIQYAFKHGELSIEQRRGIITLLPKKLKNRLLLKNWRPITLLNTDYKIIAKILAKRMQTVLPSLIHNDQTGYIKGRYIGQNIRTLEDVTFFANKENLPGILLSIDYEKAFDSLNWNFLFQTLRAFNFGDRFISLIKVMYNNIHSAVINNGNITEFFKLEKGVRQGCPLSAYLFILALEVLALSIRKNSLIKGFKIGTKEVKLSMLADDLTCILRDLDSVHNLLDTIKRFSQCAGLKMNQEKTKAKYIGSLKNSDYYPHGLSWIKSPMETLGIVFTDTEHNNYKYNFEKRIKSFKTILDIWKQRNLSLKGKVTVLNTLALPSLIYVSSVIDTPKRVIAEIDNLIANFIWDNKTPKISKRTLIQNITKGGLKLCDYDTKVKALKLSWVSRLTTDDTANWKILPKHFFNNIDLTIYFNAHQNIIKNHSIPVFYKDIHNLWMTKFKYEPSCYKEILEESLWLNKYITINNKPVCWKSWMDSGIYKIGHILDKNGNFLCHQKIRTTFNISCNFLNILQLRQSIPLKWRSIISNSNDKVANITNNKILVKINNSVFPCYKLKCKEIYWHLINQTCHLPASKKKWSEIFTEFQDAHDDIWERIYCMSFNITRETKLQSFQYKIIHRIIACNKWLHNIKIKLCSTCEFCECDDNIQHFLLFCTKTKEFWNHWFNWWENTSSIDISNCDHTAECILFGYPGQNDIITVLNYCILIAKYFIYINKMLGKNEFDMYSYLIILKQKLLMEKQACQSENSSFDKFDFIMSSL